MGDMGRKGWFFLGLGVCILLLVPFLVKGYWIRLLTNMFMFGILAESVNIIAGYCGYLALGNLLYFGIGAYIQAVLMTRFGFSFFPALAFAGMGASLFAAIVGFLLLRLRGQYFLMGTMALLELLREITSNLSITGGGTGISLPIFPGDAATANLFFYYFMFGLMVLSVVCTYFISRSHLGYAFRAIKLDEDVASVMGISPAPYKTAAWAVSAFFTSLSGAGYAYWMTYIDPGEVYQVTPSIKMYLMMVLGGGGTILGPIWGAFFIEFISELVWGKFLEIHFLILGLILVLVVIFAPRGFVNLFRRGLTISNLVAGLKQTRV
jgi:branched-chain amino acid transport system permease protein